jgi:hypothetical protein
VDPLVDETGTPYAFTAGDPVNGSDPSGSCGVNTSSVGGFFSSLASDANIFSSNNCPHSWVKVGQENFNKGYNELSPDDQEADSGVVLGGAAAIDLICPLDALADIEPAAAATRGGETDATIYGRAAHQEYDYGPGFEKEFTLQNGQRADAVNLETREVVELKPNNPAAIARGLRQVQGYAQQLDAEFPGVPFTYRVETYTRP